MSFEETTDLANFCEFDEYDSYQSTSSSSFIEYGVPLSVELSESLCESQTPVKKQTSNCFVKAPEIFLRFDSTITSATSSHASRQSDENDVLNKLENSDETISLGSNEKNKVNICDDCVELQYENEFENPNDEVDDGNSQVIYDRSNSSDNDYEELFLEGIN